MGDSKPASGENSSAKAPPTILKPGEVAPGSSQRVRLPVSLPDTPPDKTTPAPAAPSPTAEPGNPSAAAPANQPVADAPEDKTADAPNTSTH
jgi:hypothetical protein